MESLRILTAVEKSFDRKRAMDWILDGIRDWMNRATPQEKYALKRKLRSLAK